MSRPHNDMTITNGYTTLDYVKASLEPRTIATNATDDAFIERLVESVSRYIDRMTGRTFYPRAEARYYDTPMDATLLLDDDLLAVTSITNGDGTTLESTDYILLPPNRYPKYAIKLRDTSLNSWEPTSASSYEQAVVVSGSWGGCSGSAGGVPEDIRLATEQVTICAYKRRMGDNMTSESFATAAGVAITPEDVPAFARKIMSLHLRPVIRGA